MLIHKPSQTDKQRYLLLRIASGIEAHHLKAICNAWNVDAVYLPIGRGIDCAATVQRLAQHVMIDDKIETS